MSLRCSCETDPNMRGLRVCGTRPPKLPMKDDSRHAVSFATAKMQSANACQRRLAPAKEENQVRLRIAVKDVGRHLDFGDQPLSYLAPAEDGGNLHRAGKVVDVKRIRIDPRPAR